MTTQTFRGSLLHLWMQLPFLAWLVLLWMLLWNQFTVLSLLSGILVAIIVKRVFRLPTVELSGRINPWYAFLFIIQFLWAVVVGAISVAAAAFHFGRQPGTAIIAIPLRYPDDLVMTHVSVVSSLIPGSLVVEPDRERGILYLHVIGPRDRKEVEEMRAGILRWERRVVRAIGSPAQYRALRADENREREAARGRGSSSVTDAPRRGEPR